MSVCVCTQTAIYIGYLLVIVLPTNCVSPPGKHFIHLSLSTCPNSFLTIFHPDPCVLPIQISLLDQPVLLATFPLRPFLCLHLLLGTLYLHTFVLSTPYPPLTATQNSISSSLPLPSSHPVPAPQICSRDFWCYINLYVCMYVCVMGGRKGIRPVKN